MTEEVLTQEVQLSHVYKQSCQDTWVLLIFKVEFQPYPNGGIYGVNFTHIYNKCHIITMPQVDNFGVKIVT